MRTFSLKTIALKLLFNATLLLSTLHFAFAALAGPGDLDTSFGAGGKVATIFGGGQASALASTVQSDGKLILAGYRTTYYSLGGVFLTARFTTNNELDNTFGLGGIVTTFLTTNECTAEAVAVQPDGKIVVAGYAYRKTTNADFAVVRYNTNGTLDTTFGTNGAVFTEFGQQAILTGMALQADGKIVVDGYLGSGGIALARYKTNGAPDTSFGTGGKISVLGGEYDTLRGIAVQPDQKILAVGNGAGAEFALYRFTTNGTTDTSFGGGTGRVLTGFTPGDRSAIGYCVSYQSGGPLITDADKIVAAGTYYDYTSNPAKIYQLVIRYTTDGALDPAFGNGGIVTNLMGNGIPSAHGLRISGTVKGVHSITVGGSYSDGVSNYFAVCHYNGAGQLDTTFGAGNSGKISIPLNPTGGSYPYEADASSMVVQSGEFVVVGTVGASENGHQFAAVRFTAAGQVDTGFGNHGVLIADVADGNSQARAVAIQSDGKVVAVGHNSYLTNNDVGERFAIARYNTDGSLDNSFGHGGKVTISFGFSTYDDAYAVAVQPNGKIVVGGTGAGGFSLARLNHGGSLDASFGTNGLTSALIGGGGGQIYCLQIQPDGKILAAGYVFGTSSYNFALARFTANGLLDTTFGSGGSVLTSFAAPYDLAYGMALQPNGKITLAGTAVGANGGTYTGDFAAAHYNTNGALDFSFGTLGRTTGNVGSGTIDIGYAMTVQPDGKILIAGGAGFGNIPGYLTGNFGGNSFLAVMRFDTNGTPDNSFGTGGGVITQVGTFSDFATAIALQTDGKILVSGATQNGFDRFFALRYTTNGQVDSSYGNNGATVVNFGTSSNEVAYAMALDFYGRAVLAGDVGGAFGLARLQGDAFVGPTLKISLTATNTCVVSWPYPSSGWYLAETTNVLNELWSAPDDLVYNDGINNFILLAPTSLNHYYRLQTVDPTPPSP